MKNSYLGDQVEALALELWPLLCDSRFPRWSGLEREIFAERVSKMPIDFEQAKAALVNFKCSFARSFPTVGQLIDALRGAVNTVKPSATSHIVKETPEQARDIAATEADTMRWLLGIDDATFRAVLFICRQWPQIGERFKRVETRDQVAPFPIMRGFMLTAAEFAGLVETQDADQYSLSSAFARRMLAKHLEAA